MENIAVSVVNWYRTSLRYRILSGSNHFESRRTRWRATGMLVIRMQTLECCFASVIISTILWPDSMAYPMQLLCFLIEFVLRLISKLIIFKRVRVFLHHMPCRKSWSWQQSYSIPKWKGCAQNIADSGDTRLHFVPWTPTSLVSLFAYWTTHSNPYTECLYIFQLNHLVLPTEPFVEKVQSW